MSNTPTPKADKPGHGPFAVFVAGVVTVVWAVSSVVDTFSNSYQVSPVLHSIMLLVVGTILGRRGWILMRKNGNGDHTNSE